MKNQPHKQECCEECKSSLYYLHGKGPLVSCTDPDCKCHQPTTQGWEDEFDDEFMPYDGRDFADSTIRLSRVKSFIHQNFISKSELKEKIEGAIKNIDECDCWPSVDYCPHYEREKALSDLLQDLELNE